MATYRTSMWGKTVAIAGDFSKASSPVYGVGGGRGVDYFHHRPEWALRAALEEFAFSCGEDLDDDNVLDDIDMALENIIEDDDNSYVEDE